MSRYADLTGQTFQRWTVLRLDHITEESKVAYWECRCVCGNVRAVRAASLRAGISKSCGCARIDELKKNPRHVTHGQSRTHRRLYRTWKRMRQRCRDQGCPNYKNYGGRGITIDPRWDDFSAFVKDMADGWFAGASIERKDVNGNYTADNCVWITMAEQAKNKTTTYYVEYQGQKRRLRELCSERALNFYTVKDRLKRGWTLDRALAEDPKKYHRRAL